MTEPLQVGQFAIVDHEPVDRGPNAGIFEGKGPVNERAELFVLAEGTTPASEAFAGHVVTAIGTAWGGFDMSLSGCLTSAFREAERNVWDWNRKSIAQHQVSIGLTCFAHRGNQAIVAQTGPGVAFHLHGGELLTYYARGDKARAIGSGAPPEPNLTRVDLQPGDRVLLLSTSGVEELEPDVIAGILALPGQQALQDLYQRLRGQRHITALLIAAPEAEAEDVQPPRGAREATIGDDDAVIDATHDERRGFQPSLFIDDEHEADVEAARKALVSISTRASARSAPHAPLAEHFSIQPLQRAVGESHIADLAERMRSRLEHPNRQPLGAPPPTRAEAAQGTVASPPRPIWNSSSASGGSQPRTGSGATRVDSPQTARNRSFQRGLVNESSPAIPGQSSAYAAAPPVGELAAERTRRLQAATSTGATGDSVVISGGSPLVRTRDNMGGRWKGNGSLSRGRTTIGGGWFNDRILILGAIALFLIVLVFFVAPRLFGANGPSAEDLLADAQAHYQTSQASTNPADQRVALTEAESLLLEAQDAGGQSIESTELFNQVAGALSVLDNIVAPTSVETIADLSQFGNAPVTPSDMEVGSGYVFLLDTSSSQVIAQPTGGTAPTVVYGVDAELGHDRPMAIAMLPNGLLVLDASGHFWLAFPGYDPSPVVLNAPAGMAITDLAVASGDLFVLDAAEAAIYRFTPTANGFEDAPEVFFAAPGLKQAARLLIDRDVMTMTADGTINRYTLDGAALTLSQAGIDQKVASAQQLRTFDGGDSFAYPDPQQDRIVVVRRDGTFDRQYQSDAFAGLSALAMDDSYGYVFAGGHIERITW